MIVLQQPKSKFHNTKTVYNGTIYHSKLESDYARDLDLLLYSGNVISYQSQVPIKIIVNDMLICRYIMDFVVEHPNYTELVEVKGFQTAVFKLKRKLLEATVLKEHPDWVYTIIEKNGAVKNRSNKRIVAKKKGKE